MSHGDLNVTDADQIEAGIEYITIKLDHFVFDHGDIPKEKLDAIVEFVKWCQEEGQKDLDEPRSHDGKSFRERREQLPELSDAEILEKNGWTIEGESPFEIRHSDGSFAKDQAAQAVLTDLRGEERVGYCSLCYTSIYGFQGRFVDESSDGKPRKMYHDVCKIALRAETAERKLAELQAQHDT